MGGVRTATALELLPAAVNKINFLPDKLPRQQGNRQPHQKEPLGLMCQKCYLDILQANVTCYLDKTEEQFAQDAI